MRETRSRPADAVINRSPLRHLNRRETEGAHQVSGLNRAAVPHLPHQPRVGRSTTFATTKEAPIRALYPERARSTAPPAHNHRLGDGPDATVRHRKAHHHAVLSDELAALRTGWLSTAPCRGPKAQRSTRGVETRSKELWWLQPLRRRTPCPARKTRRLRETTCELFLGLEHYTNRFNIYIGLCYNHSHRLPGPQNTTPSHGIFPFRAAFVALAVPRPLGEKRRQRSQP